MKSVLKFGAGFLLGAIVLTLVTLVAVCPAIAAGTTATIIWTHPVAYTDGQPLPLNDIASTTVTWYRPGTTIPLGSVVITAPTATATIPGLVCGNFEFSAKTTVKSVPPYPGTTSNETNKAAYPTGIACAPNPPTGVTAS